MPPARLWLFSIKVYAAAMLALWIAFAAAAQYPYWAMMVVYILALPTTGAMRQKAVYMTCGTIVGALLAVATSSIFASSEIEQVICMALLASAAGYFALRDRLPSFYFFLLAAITCLLVGLPGLTTPDQAFSRAVERIQDVVIGVGCMLLVDQLVFPAMITPQIYTATDAWLDAWTTWCAAALRGQDDQPALKTMLTKASAVDPIARQMRYEGVGYAWTRSRVALAMRGLALRLVPTVSQLRYLDAHAGSSPYADIRERLAARLGQRLSPGDLARLRSPPTATADVEARCIRRIAMAWWQLRRLRVLLAAKRPRWLPLPGGEHAMPTTLAHADRGYAWRTSMAVLMFFAIMCSLWTFANWPTTIAIGLLLGTVFLIISGQPDDPVPVLRHIFAVLVTAFGVDALYLLVILPPVTSFGMLALVLLPALLVLGFLLTRPGGLLYAILPMALIRLGNTGATASFDMLTAFAAGLGVGLCTVLAVTLVFRRLPPHDALRRLRVAQRADLTRHGSTPDAAWRAIDRLALIQSRAPASLEGDLSDLRLTLAPAARRA